MIRHTALGRTATARVAGLNPETLRYYEHLGLIDPPGRSANGYRVYAPATLSRLAVIRELKGLGFTLREIRVVLVQSAQRRLTCGNAAPLADRKLAELDAKIQALQRTRRRLVRLRDACSATGGAVRCAVAALAEGAAASTAALR